MVVGVDLENLMMTYMQYQQYAFGSELSETAPVTLFRCSVVAEAAEGGKRATCQGRGEDRWAKK